MQYGCAKKLASEINLSLCFYFLKQRNFEITVYEV